MTDSYAYLLIKAIITLSFVLGLLGVSLYALKYYMNRSGKGGSSRASSPVKVLNTFFLGQKKNLTIVEVAGEVMVLGVTPTTVTFLAKIEKKESLEELKRLNGSRSRNILSLFN
ncbi:MAG: flagellar biosynthetic protein FliO [Deltaproteobacteria bacterium]|nr:flagellar biosynthetic protein FliO [Deltaproteobacteria bacterium]